MDGQPRWKRVLLKLSGQVFSGDDSFGISYETVASIAADLKEVREGGVDVAVVVGGGNIIRGQAAAEDTSNSLGVFRSVMVESVIINRVLP